MKSALLLIFAICTTIFIHAQNGVELIEERTANSKTYALSNGGQEQLISAGPVHYMDNGTWSPIGLNFIQANESFINDDNPLSSSFPIYTGINDKIEYSSEGGSFSIGLDKSLILYSASGIYQNLNVEVNNVEGQINSNELLYANVFPSMSEEYIIQNGAVKHNFKIEGLTNSIQNAQSEYFGFEEEFYLPNDWSIVPLAASNSELIESALKILNDKGDHLYTIPAPIFYEEGDAHNDGSTSVQGAFYIDKRAGNWIVTTLIPLDWLKANGRQFPVIMDPAVTLNGVTGGWQSQNNYVNNPGYVFIGVCCGNLEHRAWIKWDVSSIPDNACVTSVELLVYVNGVGASTPELVHAYDMMETTTTGLFGPYGGILPAVYADQGNGYYTSFTLAGIGTYSWYNLGANACTDVMQMMNSYDMYQVSLIFDNEPSTNWKRLTGTSCQLRITYDDPPCAPLPVSMTEFDLSCDNDYAVINWSTATENNSDYFSVLGSRDGIEFVEIAKVKAQGTSVSEVQYNWTSDEFDIRYPYYKLTQTDLDGTITDYGSHAFHECSSSSVNVNVISNSTIEIRGTSEVSEIVILDQMGRKITQVTNDSEINTVFIDGLNVAPGIYSATLINKNGKKEVIRFIL